MNAQQKKTVQRVTAQAAQALAALHMCPMVFTVQNDPAGLVLVGTNATEELRWFERSVFLMAWIGPRGGAEFRDSDIVPAKRGPGLSVRPSR